VSPAVVLPRILDRRFIFGGYQVMVFSSDNLCFFWAS